MGGKEWFSWLRIKRKDSGPLTGARNDNETGLPKEVPSITSLPKPIEEGKIDPKTEEDKPDSLEPAKESRTEEARTDSLEAGSVRPEAGPNPLGADPAVKAAESRQLQAPSGEAVGAIGLKPQSSRYLDYDEEKDYVPYTDFRARILEETTPNDKTVGLIFDGIYLSRKNNRVTLDFCEGLMRQLEDGELEMLRQREEKRLEDKLANEGNKKRRTQITEDFRDIHNEKKRLLQKYFEDFWFIVRYNNNQISDKIRRIEAKRSEAKVCIGGLIKTHSEASKAYREKVDVNLRLQTELSTSYGELSRIADEKEKQSQNRQKIVESHMSTLSKLKELIGDTTILERGGKFIRFAAPAVLSILGVTGLVTSEEFKQFILSAASHLEPAHNFLKIHFEGVRVSLGAMFVVGLMAFYKKLVEERGHKKKLVEIDAEISKCDKDKAGVDADINRKKQELALLGAEMQAKKAEMERLESDIADKRQISTMFKKLRRDLIRKMKEKAQKESSERLYEYRLSIERVDSLPAIHKEIEVSMEDTEDYYRDGNEEALRKILHKVLKRRKGKGDPDLIRRIIIEEIDQLDFKIKEE